MAYNKTKHIEAAQKNVNQGKIPQAIEEFKAVLKHEPRDQATLMAIGDLFVRQGETFQAIEYFERLAQIFLGEGFVAKAIAIYKKIAKLAPEQTRPIERLAELYVQQGILSEARPIYLHLSEQHQRAGRDAQAAALLRKLLEAEPDSPRVQTRLAELCLAMGQKAEAAEAYRTAAEHLHRRGDHDEALQFADRALENDPSDLPSSVLKARVMIGLGQRPEAIALLQSLAEAGASGGAIELLLDLYLEDAEYDRAAALAEKIFARNSRSFAAMRRVVAGLLDAQQADRALPLLDRVRQAMTDMGEHEPLSQLLSQAAEQLPERIEPREWLVELYQRASDSFRLPDALAELAKRLEAAKQYDRARKIYEQMLDRDPENEAARRNYQQAMSRLVPGGAAPEQEPPASPAPSHGAAPAAAPGEPPLDEATQQFINQSLTDVDLFSTYGLTQKAIDLLEVVLERAPRHTPSIERLLDLYLGAGNERRTAELASRLMKILSERGDYAGAERFELLQRRFSRAADLSSGEAAPEASSSDTAPAEGAAPGAASGSVADPARLSSDATAAQDADAELTVHEVDLSDEWAALAGELKAATSSNIFGEEPIASASTVAESSVASATDHAQMSGSNPSAGSPSYQAGAESEADSHAASAGSRHRAQEDTPVYMLDFEADAVSHAAIGSPSAPATEADAGSSSPSRKDFLQTLSADLTSALPEVKLPPAKVKEATLKPYSDTGSAAPHTPPLPDTTAPGPLSDLFDEFRSELNAMADDEDPETHYNLGVAYREMGLLEEAISEFQKVAKTGNGTRAFRYAMQCCTLLGLSFMEKGQPLIAAMWYERALEIPGLEQESILALRYDLGVAQELAGETAAARKSFSQVYGMNIDYRDVAERLAALGKGKGS